MEETQANNSLIFAELREANVSRCVRSFHPLSHWNIAEWGNAMAGEVGEACKITKKMLRGDADITDDDLASEIADVVIYADLLTASRGIDLDSAIRKKFNQLSVKMFAPERL